MGGGGVFDLKEIGGLVQIWIEICCWLIISGADSNTSFVVVRELVVAKNEHLGRQRERERYEARPEKIPEWISTTI